ncbi:MAG TPA: PPK2 family polyphosphate kinase [Propionibacteriaceae bacterium]|nr:PPK2 family polyphosphate kinase [Propionibacteriaceae bacterium]
MGSRHPGWTADPRDLLRAGPGFTLEDVDRGGTPGFRGRKSDAERFGRDRGRLLSELQERLFAEGRTGGTRSVLCVVQGLDTAGKGGVTRHVMSMVDPQGVALHSFGPPSEEELRHDFLWRIRNALPRPGLIGVFDRSHYEDVLVVRVKHLVPDDEWESRYDQINHFEKELVDSGTVLLKFALMVSHDEQGIRLMERLDRPDKRWKFNPSDLETRAQWADYQAAYQAVFERTSTDWAPWYVIPSDHKWYSRVAITEIVTQTLVDMNPGWPEPDWDPFEMRDRLAELMSSRALTESLADTTRTVAKAVAADAKVQREEIEVSLDDVDSEDAAARADERAALAEVTAQRAAYVAEAIRTKQQKQRLVTAAKARETLR